MPVSHSTLHVPGLAWRALRAVPNAREQEYVQGVESGLDLERFAPLKLGQQIFLNQDFFATPADQLHCILLGNHIYTCLGTTPPAQYSNSINNLDNIFNELSRP